MAFEKQFSLHKRPTSPDEREKKRAGKRYNGVWYVQFKLPSGGFSTAKSTKQTSQGAAEAWAVEQIRTGNIPQASTDRSSIKGYIGAFWTRSNPYVRKFGEPDDEGYAAPISEAKLDYRATSVRRRSRPRADPTTGGP